MFFPVILLLLGLVGIAAGAAEDDNDDYSPYGEYPLASDPFHFMPCTTNLLWSLPDLDDDDAAETWASEFNPDPLAWTWGKDPDPSRWQWVANKTEINKLQGRGIYMCGYLDVPLDFSNGSDERIVRVAVAKYQISGLARLDGYSDPAAILRDTPTPGQKSERTIIHNPGGPGGRGTYRILFEGEYMSQIFGGGDFDVLGWDPRGVGTSKPVAICTPNGKDESWGMILRETPDVSEGAECAVNTRFKYVDAFKDAQMNACHRHLGDIPRFLGTASTARELEEIRKALGEEEVTGIFSSYGTSIAQLYAGMFPNRVGRMVLDGPTYYREDRRLGGFATTPLNATDAWHDGFLPECIARGWRYCALAHDPANPRNSTLSELRERMGNLLKSLMDAPVASYSPHRGPVLITYNMIVQRISFALRGPRTWRSTARLLSRLEQGHTDGVSEMLFPRRTNATTPSTSVDLLPLVVCADSYDAPEESVDWWQGLMLALAQNDWIKGRSLFNMVIQCRHFNKYWKLSPSSVFRGDLGNVTLRTPLLIVAVDYDPATSVNDGRRLQRELGDSNAHLIVQHGYGHAMAADRSKCTELKIREYMANGTLPKMSESTCDSDDPPFLANDEHRRLLAGPRSSSTAHAAEGAEEEGNTEEATRDPSTDDLDARADFDAVQEWVDYLEDLAISHPYLVRDYYANGF